MGFGKNERRIWFKLKNGKVVITIKPEMADSYSDIMADATKVENISTDKGVPMIEISLDNFMGYLEKMDVADSDFGKTWNITFTDDTGMHYVWTTYYDGGMIQSFVNCISSVEGKLGLIKLQPWMSTDKKGQLVTKLTIYHNGDKLSWKYSPEEIPKITTLKDDEGNDAVDPKTNKPIYNTKKRMVWLLELVTSIQEKLKASGVQSQPATQSSNGYADYGAAAQKVDVEVTDEVPF